MALQIAETVTYYYGQEQLFKPSKSFPVDYTEGNIIVTLINVRSLYDTSQFSDCFELLQYEFLRNSKHTGLLYLYGKYIIKANSILRKEDEIGVSKSFD